MAKSSTASGVKSGKGIKQGAANASTGSSKTSATHKPSSGKGGTVLDKIIFAIRALQQISAPSDNANGISRLAITKYLKSELQYDNPNALKAAIKKGVSSKTLLQTGQSFRVSSDPVDERNVKESIQSEEIPSKKQTNLNDNDNSVKEVETAARGKKVTVSYVGTLFENGYEFDRSTNFSFVLGAGEVIKGWDLGVEGMKVGNTRKLIVPPHLGYGKRGCKPDIPGNATLCFTIKLKKVS